MHPCVKVLWLSNEALFQEVAGSNLTSILALYPLYDHGDCIPPYRFTSAFRSAYFLRFSLIAVTATTCDENKTWFR
jgi:hypothetical protein